MIILLVVTGVLLFTACGEPTKHEEDGSFAIYIAKETASPGTPLYSLSLLERAFLVASDMTAYDWSEHHISFSESVHQRLKSWGNLLNRIFVVTVEKDRIYWGMFKDDLDSGGCQNPVIMLMWRHPDGRNTVPPSIRIERAYPGYMGPDEDPDLRVDPRVHEALNSAGVLVP